jgi:Carbohydrate binding domain
MKRLILALAWSWMGGSLLAADVVLDFGKWQLETQNGAEARLEASSEAPDPTLPALLVSVTKPGLEFWSVELRAPNLSFAKGKTYELTFRAKAAPRGYVYFVLEKQTFNQAAVALGTNLRFPTEWAECTVAFTVTEDANPGRLTISSLSVNPAKFWFADFHLKEKAPGS